VLPRLCERVVLPSVVRAELGAADAPVRVQSWIANPPTWLDIVLGPMVVNPAGIHKGEAAAIALAGSMGADLLLIDDRRGVRAAKQQGLRVTGTLGILDLAAERGDPGGAFCRRRQGGPRAVHGCAGAHSRQHFQARG